jgi:hypothetical protein
MSFLCGGRANASCIAKLRRIEACFVLRHGWALQSLAGALYISNSFTALRAVEGWKCRTGFRSDDVTVCHADLLRASN